MAETRIKITDKPIASSVNSTDKIFINNGGALKQAGIDDVVNKSNLKGVVDKSVDTLAKATSDLSALTEVVNMKAPVIVQKASGSDILIKDGSDRPVIDFTSYGKSEQKQYSGKNKFKMNRLSSYTKDGVTFTPVYTEDGTEVEYVIANGTAGSNVEYVVGTFAWSANTEYILNGCPKGGANLVYKIKSDSNGSFNDFGNGANVKYDTDKTTSIIIVIYTGQTVSNLKFYPMISAEGGEYEPYVGGTASPNPSYPQTIKSVGDSGYCDGELLQGMYATADGLFASNSNIVCSKNPMPCKAGDKVTLTYEVVTNALYIFFYDKDMKFISRDALANVSTITSTAPANAKWCHINVSNTVNMTPSQAKHICVTINGMYALIVKSVNKNLWEFGDRTFTLREHLYKTLPAGTYTFSAVVTSSDAETTYSRVYFGAKDGSTIAYADMQRNTRSSITVVCDKEIAYISLYAGGYYNVSVNDTATYADIQLELDDTMTDFVEHEEQTTYIPLTEPLRSIGEVKNSVKKVDGSYGEGRKFVALVFDGSDDEGWSGMTTYADRFYIPASKLPNLKPRTVVMCSHYAYSANLATVDYGIYMGNDLNVKNKDITTFADFKASLSANPITVIAELANEIFESFQDQTQIYFIKTFDGVTLISSDADMEIEYATDTKIYVDNKITEVCTALLNA